MYRDGVFTYNGPNTINQFTDNTQLNINTVYEYSVVAISCAGTSTAGVKSIKLGKGLYHHVIMQSLIVNPIGLKILFIIKRLYIIRT